MQDERDDEGAQLPPREQNESATAYFSRLDKWVSEIEPTPGEGETTEVFHKRIQTWRRREKAVDDAKIRLIVELETYKQLETRWMQLDRSGSVLELLETHRGLPQMRRNTQAESSMEKNTRGKRDNETSNVAAEGKHESNKKHRSFL